MTELPTESIKKNELKAKRINRELKTQGTKENLLNRLLKAIQDVESESRKKQMKRKKNT